MIGITVQAAFAAPVIEEAMIVAGRTAVRYTAFKIRKYVRESIKKSEQASAAGSPVATRGRRGNVRNSIFAAIEKRIGRDEAIIGPRFSHVGLAMFYHEFGGSRFANRYAARPTMRPGLDKNLHVLTDQLRGSLSGTVGPGFDRFIGAFGDSFRGSVGQ